MKPKTAVLIVLIALAVLAPIRFIMYDHNQEILHLEFVFLGYAFSVAKALATCMILAAVAPSLYFSYKYTRIVKRARSAEKEQKSTGAVQSRTAQASDRFLHGDYAGALVLAEEGSDVGDRILTARIHMAMDEETRAQTLLERVFEETGNVQAGYLLADILLSKKQSPLDVLRTLIKNHADQALTARRMLLNYYDEKGAWTECISLAQELTGLGVETHPKVMAGYRYEQIRQQEDLPNKKVVEQYQRILKECPDFVPASLGLGDTYMLMGLLEKAFGAYEHAFKQTHNPVFLDRLEQFYLEQGHPEDAIQIYRELLVRLGGPLVKFQLGKLYYKLEMTDEALDILEPLQYELGDIPGYLFYLSELRARRRRMPEALGALAKLIRVSGFNGEDFVCSHCKTPYKGWESRCGACKQWDTITLEAGLVDKDPIPLTPIRYD